MGVRWDHPGAAGQGNQARVTILFARERAFDPDPIIAGIDERCGEQVGHTIHATESSYRVAYKKRVRQFSNHPMNTPQAVVFDLLTALLDSWSVWDEAAGNEADGRRWRARYLELTYDCGVYRPYETLVAEAARDAGLPPTAAAALHAL